MAAPTTDDKNETSWDDYLGQLIAVFSPVLCSRMRVTSLLWLIDIKEVKDKRELIWKKEADGNSEDAVKELLNTITTSSQLGKWQMFIDALREEDETGILNILLEEELECSTWMSDEESRHVISIFSKNILQALNLQPLLRVMLEKRLILKTDWQRLKAMLESGKSDDAIGSLLLIMHRHSNKWYTIFMGILCDDDYHHDLAEQIDKDFCIKWMEGKEVREDRADGDILGSSSQMTASGDCHSLPGSQSEGDTVTPSGNAAVTAGQPKRCLCQCCAQVLTKLTILETQVVELKALVSALVASPQSRF